MKEECKMVSDELSRMRESLETGKEVLKKVTASLLSKNANTTPTDGLTSGKH